MIVYVDGNPKEVCCVVDGKVDRAKLDGKNTNNEAEYRAVLFGLYKHPETKIICSDSQLIVRQLQGNYAVKNERLLYCWKRVMERIDNLGHNVQFVWTPRADNPAGKVLG